MGPKSKRSKKPDVPLSKVPPIRELCEKLGFQHASLKDTRAFEEMTRAWRKSYTTSNGTSGNDLLLWNEPSVQLDLQSMAEDFVRDNSNGERFWSSTRSWNQDSEIQFPEDFARIVELLKQLFWRQNRYAANNNVYAQNKAGDNRDRSREKTPRPYHLTDLNERTLAAVHSPISMDVTAAQNQASDGGVSWPGTPRNVDLLPDENAAQRNGHPVDIQHVKEKDVYEVSDDDDSSTNIAGKSSDKSPIQPSRPLKTKRTLNTNDMDTRKKLRTNSGDSLRRTDRKRVRPDRPGIVPFVSDDLYEQMTKTPPPIQDPLPEPQVENLSKNMSGEVRKSLEAYSSHHAHPGKSYNAPTASMVPGSFIGSASVVPDTSNLSTDALSNSEISDQAEMRESNLDRTGPTMPETWLASFVSSDRADQAMSDILTSTTADSAGTIELQERLQSLRNSLTTVSEAVSDAKARRAYVTLAEDTDDNIMSSLESAPKSLTEIRVELAKSLGSTKRETPKPTLDEKFEELPTMLKTSHDDDRPPGGTTLSKPRTKTQVHLWIITREPRYTEERWPDGKFSGAQLSDFLEGVSKVTQRGHIEKLKLTLQTLTADTKFTVRKDDEDEWTLTKKTFGEKLKEATREAKLKTCIEPVVFKILIEPFYEERSRAANSVDDDEPEVDF